MRRVSHPNMKPGQRKFRKLSASEQWFEDSLLLARAEAALDAAAPDDPRREQLECGIAFLRERMVDNETGDDDDE